MKKNPPITKDIRMYKPRPWLVVLLTLIFPGLGYYYAGISFWPAIGLTAAISSIKTISVAVPAHWLSWKTALAVPVTLAIIADIFLAIHATRLAKSNPSMVSNRRYFRFIFSALLVAIVTTLWDEIPGARAAKNFHMPTVSMEPTVKSGDRIRTTLVAYPQGQLPKVGEIVAFKYPKDPSITYVKRVVAVAGDKIRIVKDSIVLNEQGHPLKSHDFDRTILNDISDDKKIKQLFTETIGGNTHWIMLNVPASKKYTNSDWPDGGDNFLVPDATFFVLGDNRDNSVDSREFGPIPRDLLVGRVEGVVFSFTSSPWTIRWNRIGFDLNRFKD
jgi:signal peptidase I